MLDWSLFFLAVSNFLLGFVIGYKSRSKLISKLNELTAIQHHTLTKSQQEAVRAYFVKKWGSR